MTALVTAAAVPRLAVLDWGVGGFGVARELGVPYDYLSDAGSAPYGRLGRGALTARVAAVVHWLAARGATHVVVACNAASTVVPEVRRRAPVQVFDVITAGVDAVRAARLRRIGVIGGYRTIRARAYRRGLGGDVEVVQRVAQPLSAMVERGELTGPSVEREVRRVVAPLGDVDAVLLACTHYPALMPVFERVLPSMRFIDPAATLAACVRASLGHTRTHPGAASASAVWTTGNPADMARAAALAFGVELAPGSVERVVI